MPLLYYWRGDNYRRDLDMGAGFHLNSANPLLHTIDLGDSLWAFTRTSGGRYVLAAELVVKAKTLNPPNFRYGPYRTWGDLITCRYFQTKDQPSVEQIIRVLSCRANATTLGQSFQGFAAVRKITMEDNRILATTARNLPLEPRARILPEERLEATLLLGDANAVASLLRPGDVMIAEQRREYLYSLSPTRNQALARQLQEIYTGRCQICLWSPTDAYGEFLCHGHHLHWLSRGGDDNIDNMVLVCPNHHAAIHKCDAPFDFADYAFAFPLSREPLRINTHL